MTPARAIAMLDRQLAQYGQTVIIRRYTAPTGDPRPKTDITVKGHVRGVKADEIIGSIKQSAQKVILSPTGLSSLLPIRTGDKVLVAGAEKNVEFASHIRMADTLVRIELTVQG